MKKITKGILSTLFAGTFVIAGVVGCSPIKNIENNEKGIIFNGGSVVSVGDYLFYGNGFASGVNDYQKKNEAEYNAAKQYSYLARVKKGDYDGDKYTSPTNVDKLADQIVGYSNSYMFVCGNYIYYVTPNMHKTETNEHIWNYISIVRCRLNGEGGKEIFTTQAYNATTAQIRALNFDNENYLVVYDGTNINLLKLGEKVSVVTISTEAASVALPKEGEDWNGYIYFTENKTNKAGQKVNYVYKVSVKDGVKGNAISSSYSVSFAFTGRVKDTLFFTKTEGSITETLILDTNNQVGDFATAAESFYSLAISNVLEVAKGNTLYGGYVFTATRANKTQVMYYNNYNAKNQGYTAEVLVEDGYLNTVAIDGINFYYTTSDKLLKKSVTNPSVEETLVSDMSMRSGYFGYDYKYVNGIPVKLNNIYFYATRVYDKDAEDYDEENATDENSYLYAISADGVGGVKLFGKTI